MPKTISGFRSELMNEFGLSETNTNDGTSSTAILEYINKAHETFVNKRHWTFNIELYSFKKLSDSTVTTTFTTAAASIVVGSSVGWGTSGKVWIDGDVIDFTGNDNINTLTVTASTISREHLAGENVVLLYQMPATFGKPAEVRMNKSLYLPDDIRNEFEPIAGRYWQYHVVDTAGNYRIWMQFPKNSSEQIVSIKYSRKPVDLTVQTATTYYLDVPNPHYMDYVKYSVMARLYRHLEERAQAESYEGKALMELKYAGVLDAKQHAGTRAPLRTAWDNPRSVLYGRSQSTYSNR